MRRFGTLAIVALFAFSCVGVAFANQNNTGCGLGSLIFEGQDGLMSQTCAATFNGIYGNQTFGITTGTSNCEKATSFASNERLNTFVSDNMDNLAMDISKGTGEYLSTLAVLMDVPVSERGDLYARLQANFSKIYTSETVDHLDVLNNIETVLSSS